MTPDALIAYVCGELFGPEYRMCATYGEACCIVELFAHAPMLGPMKGKHQRMITALRCLAQAVGRKHGLRVYLTLDEE